MRSLWLMMAAPIRQPQLLRPRLRQSRKFSCSGHHRVGVKAQPYGEGYKPLSDVCNSLPMLTAPLRFRNSLGSRRPWRTEPTWPSARGLSPPGYPIMQSATRWYRTILSNLFNSLIQQKGLTGITDTQCGFKLFRQPVAADLFGVSSIDGYGFDLELLSVAQQRGYRIAGIPVNWSHQPGSKFRIVSDGIAMLRELAVIRRNGTKGYYTAPLHPRTLHPAPVGQTTRASSAIRRCVLPADRFPGPSSSSDTTQTYLVERRCAGPCSCVSSWQWMGCGAVRR